MTQAQQLYDEYGRPVQLVPRAGGGLSAVPMGPAPTQQPVGPQTEKVPPGALVKYYSDIASGVVVPEDMRIEDLQFRVQIDPLGNIVFQTDPVMLISRYQFVLRGITGFVMDPDVAGPAPALVNFNSQEQGRNFSIFKRPISMASVVQGGETNVHWDGVYITVPGTTLEVQWRIDTARWPALVGASKEFGVQLLGDYVACAPREE